MPGPRYFDPFETPRSADGRFAEKEGSAPEVSIDGDVLHTSLSPGSFIHTSSPDTEQRVALDLALEDLEVQAAHARARSTPELFTSAEDLP